MKRFVIIPLMMLSIICIAQKKKNGTVFIEHPSIDAVESMMAAMVKGDAEAAATFLAEEFTYYNGNNNNPNYEGTKKENFLKWTDWNSENLSYSSIARQPGAYPDALVYKDGTTWVQTWDVVTGMHNETGIKMDRPTHSLFSIDKNNKIAVMIEYTSDPWEDIRESSVARKNGTLYNSHDNINTVRKMMMAIEHSDLDKAYSYFSEKARFRNINQPRGESSTLEEDRAGLEKMLESFAIDSFDVVGYPDYLEYEIGSSKVVMSWWNLRLTHKADKKKIVLPAMYVHYFNDEGEIINETGYYSMKLFEDQLKEPQVAKN
jgi:limonene-1,2-epoxide hydrolase